MHQKQEHFFGVFHLSNSGMIIDVDEKVIGLFGKSLKEDFVGKNIVSYIPDFSLDDFYVRNQDYNIQILHSIKMIGFLYYKIHDKSVQLTLLICKITLLHDFFRKASEENALELLYLFQAVAGSQDKQSALPNVEVTGIVGSSLQAKEVLNLIGRIADTDAHVLLHGETGVGKTMFANIIHEASYRRKSPFVEINCATIHKNLIESELFGYEKGSFTGALHQGKVGKIELADKGTLFLDEVTEMPLEMQQKLLQVIQDKTINRVGGCRTISVDFRLVSATNRNIEDLIQQGTFRSDLYYRLNVIPVWIPPLRNRISDILALTLHFTRKVNERYSLNRSFSKDAIQAFCHYQWPGNVRELKHLVERAILTAANTTIEVNELPTFLQNFRPNSDSQESALKVSMEAHEKNIVLDAYAKFKTSVKVGEVLGISQTSAARKIRKYLSSGGQ